MTKASHEDLDLMKLLIKAEMQKNERYNLKELLKERRKKYRKKKVKEGSIDENISDTNR